MADATPKRAVKGTAADAQKQPDRPPNRPWRAEGLPPGSAGGPPEQPRSWWGLAARGLVIFGIVFGGLTLQERLNGPETIAYSEFVKQVESGNVSEIFAHGQSIQGALKEAKPAPRSRAP